MEKKFITRQYQEVERPNSLNIEKLLKNWITLIWGDRGVGKTFQLKKYYEEHSNTSVYINARDFKQNIKEVLHPDIDVVIIDDLSEYVITDQEESEDLELIKYIYKCKKSNPQVKFILLSGTESYELIAKKLIPCFNDLYIVGFPFFYQSKQEFSRIIKHNISVILGEPASGKTFQLKQYEKDNINSHFVELITIDDEIEIEKNIEVILLDSIDEALTDYSNFKKLNSSLLKYIQSCKVVNPQIRFVISCRSHEWKEYFAESLESIEEDIKIYDICPLSDQDITQVLREKGIQEEVFFEFISEKHIKALLENIMIFFHIVNKFDIYRASSLSYIEIYQDLIKEHITKKGDNREEIVWDESLEKYIAIASSLATYLMLNRIQNIKLDDLARLADELYIIDSVPVIPSDLYKVLSTNLFKHKGHRIDFYHKSIKEYLAASFIYQKGLSTEELKRLFSHDLSFYEEFEEIIIYLTNLNPVLFNEFVAFDPYVFRRHPHLNSEQQKELLDSILYKLINEEQTAWGKWEHLQDTTLVKLDKVGQLASLVESKIDIKDINYPTFMYLLNVLEQNYSNQMEDLIFQILEILQENTEVCYKYIKSLRVKNYLFNVRLFKFLKKYRLLSIDNSFIQISNLETHLFEALYNIDNEMIESTNKMEFSEFIELLDNIPSFSLQYIVENLSPSDCQLWFEYIKKQYENAQEHDYKSKVLAWSIYGLLRNYKTYDSKTILQDIVSLLSHHTVHIQFDISENKLDECSLNFNDIEDDFWGIFFDADEDRNRLHTLEKLFIYYSITTKDIEKIVHKYPIADYIEYYITFRHTIKDIDVLLMKDDKFKLHMEKLWAKHEQDEKGRKKEDEVQDWYIEKQKRKAAYYKKVASFDSLEDIYYIFLNANYYKEGNELNEKLKNDLQDNYSKFIDMAKNEFKTDQTFIKIKEGIHSNSNFYSTLLFEFLFNVIPINEIKSLIDSPDEYKKLFWHFYKYKGLDTESFKQLTAMFFDDFLSLTSEVIELSFVQSDNHKIGISYQIINLLKALDKFNKKSVKSIIQVLSTIPISSYELLDEADRDYAFQFLTLDENQYNLIENMLGSAEENCADYLKALVALDTNKAIAHFNDTYKDIPKFIELDTEPKTLYSLNLSPSKKNYYNNEYINSKKINYFLCLVSALKSTRHKDDGVDISILKSEDLKMVIKDYYMFFKEYQRPTGSYSPDIHDDMYNYINKLWQYLETSTEEIDLLKELSSSDNKALSKRAKYTLEQAYNQQAKNKKHPNSYYKEIFNKIDIESRNIYVEGDVIGAVINEGKIKQVLDTKELEKSVKKKKWHQNIYRKLMKSKIVLKVKEWV